MPQPARRSPTLALVALSRVAELELARMLEPHALSLRKFGILTRIAATPGTSTSALARHLGLATSDLAPLLRALQDAELVRAADERSATVTITASGSRLLRALEPQLAAIDDRMFAADGDAGALAGALLDATTEPPREPQD